MVQQGKSFLVLIAALGIELPDPTVFLLRHQLLQKGKGITADRHQGVFPTGPGRGAPGGGFFEGPDRSRRGSTLPGFPEGNRLTGKIQLSNSKAAAEPGIGLGMASIGPPGLVSISTGG